MFKKFLVPLLILSMVFFYECKDDHILPDQDQTALKKGKGGGGSGGGGGGGGGEGETTAGNNLSFPVFLADGYAVSPITSPIFTVEYDGEYPGMTADEIAWLEEEGPWYAQKVEGNVWQAEFVNANATVDVAFVDWGDVIEVVNPKRNRPFRLEVTLYVDVSDDPMEGYLMALLGYPSSKDEIQGTNKDTYQGVWATVASASPNLIVQYFEDGATLTWDDVNYRWNGADPPATGFGFAPELNVGGKYIFGASMGGWRPTVLGDYRITFYIPDNGEGRNIDLANAVIGNYAGNNPGWNPPENTAATPVVDGVNNLTYVDVTVVSGGGGGGGNH